MKGVTSMVSFPSAVVGNLSLFKKENDNNESPDPAGRTLAGRQFLGDDGLTTSGRTARAFVKRLVVLFLITLFAAVNAPAEIISAVSYNPSRMGDYVYLKVADKANLKGGIEANTMTVRSGGTVSASSPNLNYNVPAVVGESGSTLDMPNTAIHGSAANTYDNYQAVNTGTPNALLNKVYVNGGTTTVKNDSYISTLDAVNRLKQKAATLRANKLSVSGSEDAILYDEATTDGFTLSGNDISQPTSSHVNTGAALSNCTLKWEERVTSNNQKVKLLALANCNGTSGTETKRYHWVEIKRLNKQDALGGGCGYSEDSVASCTQRCISGEMSTIGEDDSQCTGINWTNMECSVAGEKRNCETWGELKNYECNGKMTSVCECYWQRIIWECQAY